jgi:hypothetical protein
MVKAIHEIDPNADAVLILKNPNTSFASWSPDEVEENAKASVEASAGGGTNTETSCQAASSATSSCEEEEIHYRVSSRHLALVSPIFKSMLLGKNWNEGIRNEIDGLYHVTTEDWDMEALLILLDVLHHRNRRVPRTISLEMLAQLAVLIDYYKCAEALESFTERWVEHLKVISPIPSHVCRDLMLWMCIAWVLRLPDAFVQTTTVAIRREGEELPDLGLPIVSCVGKSAESNEVTYETDATTDRIETARMEAIGTVFSQLQELRQEYRSPLYHCPGGNSFECGSMLFGALTKEMELQGLLPVPAAPFAGWSISKLYTKIQRIQSPSWSKPKKSRHRCDLSERVMSIADPVTRLADGPRLEDFDLI